MSEPKPTSPKADDLAKRLQESLTKRRPRTWRPVIVTMVLGSLLLIALTWWMVPRPRPEPLQIVALDAVFAIGETPRIRAQLFLPGGDSGARRDGATVVFIEQPSLAAPAQKPRELTTTSDANGLATVEWPVTPPAHRGEFEARYLNIPLRHKNLDHGRVFVWPKDARLLIIDADETLIAEDSDAKAEATLKKAYEEGWRIVYLAMTATNAHDFRTARDWINNKAKLPKGPVLGRGAYPDDAPLADIRRATLGSLRDRFPGAHAVVVKSADTAKLATDLRLRTMVVGGAAVADALQVATWADLPLQLK